jgi:hypothetical protein
MSTSHNTKAQFQKYEKTKNGAALAALVVSAAKDHFSGLMPSGDYLEYRHDVERQAADLDVLKEYEASLRVQMNPELGGEAARLLVSIRKRLEEDHKEAIAQRMQARTRAEEAKDFLAKAEKRCANIEDLLEHTNSMVDRLEKA